jgi:hypothetical protein
VRIKAQKLNDSVWVLEVPGRLHLWADAVWAVGSMLPQDSGKAGGRRVLGKVNLLSVDERKMHVRLVPVDGSGGGVSAANVEQEMRPYMQTLGIRATVAVEKNLTVPGYSAGKDKLPVNRKRLNTDYGKELQRIVTAWEAAGRVPRGDTAVVFLTGPAADDTKGYMGLNNPYGFVFCGGEKPSVHTLSHELGHGLLVLEHPFGEDEGKAGQTRNLMDYNAPNGLSHMRQWQRIHDKEEVGNFLRGLRQKEEEGKYVQFRFVMNDELPGKKEEILANGFLDPGGRVIEKINYTAGGEDVFVARVLDKNYPYVVAALKVYKKNNNEYELIQEYKAVFDSIGLFRSYADFPGTLQYRTGQFKVPVYVIQTDCYFKAQKVVFTATDKSRKYDVIKQLIDPSIQQSDWKPELFFMADPSCYSQFKQELIKSNYCKDEVLIKSEVSNLSLASDKLDEKTETQFVNLVLKSCQSSLIALPWLKLRKGLHYLLNSAVSRNKQLAILSMLSAGLVEYSQRIDSLFKSENYKLTKKAFEQFDPDLLCGKSDKYAGFLGSVGAKHISNFVNSYPEFIMDYYDELVQDDKVLLTAGLSVALEPTWDPDTELKEVYIYDVSTADLPEGIEKHTAGCVQFANNKLRIGYSSVCYSKSPTGYLPCAEAVNNNFSKVAFTHDFADGCDSISNFNPADPTLTLNGNGFTIIPAILSAKMIMDKIYYSYIEFTGNLISTAMPTFLKASSTLKFNKVPKYLPAGKLAGTIVRGISKSEFINSVGDFLNPANQKIADEAWELWKAQDWIKLEELFKAKNINGKWPPNRGFISHVKGTLKAGTEFDRYGGYIDKTDGLFKDNGLFASPIGTLFENRALPLEYLSTKPYNKYRVIKDISNVKKGTVAPWFGQPGKGLQFELPISIDDLIKDGYIKLIN